MAITGQLKIIDNKIKVNQVHYNLDRLTAIIFAKLSNELAQYEYLTVENLGYKPSVVEQAKFDCSALGSA